MTVLDRIPFKPESEKLLQQVHVDPESGSAAEIRNLLHRASPIDRPKTVFAESFVEARGEDTVTIGGVTFTSLVLRANLDGVERVFPFIATFSCATERSAPTVALPSMNICGERSTAGCRNTHEPDRAHHERRRQHLFP